MRRDQGLSASEYRRQHNEEMWKRQGLTPVVFASSLSKLCAQRRCRIAKGAVASQSVGD